MLFLLDTNAVSDLMAEHPRLDARLAAIATGDSAAIVTVVRGEVLFGIERLPAGARRSRLEAKAMKILAGLPCFAIEPAAADIYARSKAACRHKGLALDENDLWIASAAIAMGATLVTR